MDPSAIFPLFVSIMFAVWAAYQLYAYAMRGTRKRVLFVSYLGFIVSFSCVVLIPFDIDSTLANLNRDFLYYAWRVMYWALQILSWIVYPFNMEKERTGSWRKSLHRNAIWWGVYAVCGIVALVYFFFVTSFGFKGLLAFAYAASNTWGLILIILLAGYGLVAAPQWMYLKSKPKDYLEYLYIKAVSAEGARMSAKYDLIDIYNDAKKTVDLRDPDMLAASHVLSATYGHDPTGSNRAGAPSSEGVPQAKEAVESDKTVALRDALQTANRSVCSWKLLVKECVRFEKIFASEQSASGVDVLQAKLHQVYCISARVFALLAGLLSVLIIIGQSTIFIDVWWLSVLAVMFRKGVWDHPSLLDNAFASFVIQACLTIPLLWIYYCCYWSLTRLKLAKFYGLYPMHNTDTISLMWCGGMLIRIAFPLVYNYLFVLRVPDHPSTVFEEMQGWMDVVPILGDTFVEYFPLLILVIALLTVTNMYSRMMKFFGLDALQFETDKDSSSRQALIDEGRKLIAKERNEETNATPPRAIELGSRKYSQLNEEELAAPHKAGVWTV